MSLWTQCVKSLEHQFNEEDLITWVHPLKAFEDNEGLNLVAPNTSIAHWIRENCLAQIRSFVDSVSEQPLSLELSVRTPLADPAEKGFPSVNQSGTEHEAERSFTSFLNPEQTFSNFIEGKSNQLAKAAAQQIAEHPSQLSNILFLYSGVGLGKTHLMHAIGNAILDKNPAQKVLYMCSERFVLDLVAALQAKKMDKFRAYYRSMDVLLIDDVQFFAGKERSQEEFFHTFNTLFESHKQIVMTCDRYPKDIANLQERLKSRFASGLTQSIEMPDLETRVAIVQMKAQQQQAELSQEVAFFIAQSLPSNIRELEGAVRRVLASVSFHNTPATIKLAEEALSDTLAAHNKALSIDEIQHCVAEFYHISLSDLLSKNRSRNLTKPRHVAMALAKELTPNSLPVIGSAFGRDHTTVIHACRKMERERKSSLATDNEYRRLKHELCG